MNPTRCLYPGSFDPVTVGHMDVISRAAAMFDTVVVGVLHHPEQRGCFPVEKRVEMLKKACAAFSNVQVISYGGLLARLAKEQGFRVVVRGVRGAGDLDSEMMMARINRQLCPGLETVFLPASPEKSDISATMVRQLASFGADLSQFVPLEALPDVLAAFEDTEESGR